MTDLDVALRVRLAYDGAAARPAKADLEAIREGAARVAAAAGPGVAARGLGDVARQAGAARVGLDELARSGGRLDAVAQSSRTLTGDLRQTEAAAISAGAAIGVRDGAASDGVRANAERMAELERRSPYLAVLRAKREATQQAAVADGSAPAPGTVDADRAQREAEARQRLEAVAASERSRIAAEPDTSAGDGKPKATRLAALDRQMRRLDREQAQRLQGTAVPGNLPSPAPQRLEDELAALLGPGAPAPFRPAPAAPEAPQALPAAPEVSRVLRAADPGAVVRPRPAPSVVATTATTPATPGDAHRDAKAEAHIAALWPSPASPNHPAFVRRPSAEPVAPPAGVVSGDGVHTMSPEAVAGRRAVEALMHSADKLGKAIGPGKLAEGIAAVSPAATEARRHIDDVADAAQHAERAAERLARTARAAGGGVASPAGDHAAAAGGGHSGPGGLRGALMAGARPLRMERIVMSAFTPVGAMGLVAGLGLEQVGRGLKAVEEQAVSFEAAMVAVKRAVGDVPDDALKALESDLLKVSATTGAAKEEVAALAAAAARGGVARADLGRTVERTVKVANVLGATPEEAGEKLTRYRKDWHANQGASEDTTDAIALLAQRNGANGAALFDLVNAAAPLRANFMSARQAAAIGATAQHAGVAPDAAMGLFGDLTGKLARPETAGQDFKNSLFHDLHIGTDEARLGMRTDPTTLITRVLDGLKKMPEAARARAAERLLGPEQGQQLAKFAGDVDTLRKNFTLAEDAAQRTGSVDRLFKTFDDTATAKVEKAGRAFEGFATKLGARFLPAVKAAADGTAKLFDGLGRYLDRSDMAASILKKQEKGEALSPEEQKGVDHDPKLRQFIGMDPDPVATKAGNERERSTAEANIRALEKSARENGDDPQIKAMVTQAKEDYRQKFPGAPLAAFAAGGRVVGLGGPREDKVPAWLSAGEFVVKASAAGRYHGLLSAINDDRIPHFADGGPVGLAASPGVLAARDSAAPARVLQRGIERGLDPEGMARMLAKLGPEAHGKPLTVEQIKMAMVEGTKAGVVAGLREAMDMRGGRAAGGIIPAAFGGDGVSGQGGDGPRPGRARDATPSDRPHPHDRHLDTARLREQAERHRGRVRPREDAAPADDDRPRPPMPGGGEGRADPASLKGVLFKGESGGDPGIYNHRVGGRYRSGHLDPNNTTVAELMRRQAAGEVFAAGKYQIIPKTMQGAVKALHLKGDEKFDSALQDRIYTDYLAGSKRPQISAYVTGKSDDLRGANIATAEEWASVGDPSRSGRGHYDGDGANHASISVARAQAALKKARDDYQHLIQKGVDPETARRSALLGIRDPQAPAQPPVADRRPAPAQPTPPAPPAPQLTPVAENPPTPRRHRAAEGRPITAAPVRMAAGGRVIGPGGPREDRVPAMLSHGEFVVHAAAAAKHPGLLAALNDGNVPAGSGASRFSSARFSDPTARPTPRAADAGAASGGAGGIHGAAGPAPIQNFYGMHDPAMTARRAQQERNREVRRAQARALHSVGRIS